MSRAVNVHLPEALYEACQRYAEDNGIKVPDVVRIATARHLSQSNYYITGNGRGGPRRGAGRKKHDTPPKESNMARALKTTGTQTDTGQPTETNGPGATP